MPARGAPLTLLDLDLGDDALVVQEHPDGLFTMTLGNQTLVLTAEDMGKVVAAMVTIGRAKGWI